MHECVEDVVADVCAEGRSVVAGEAVVEAGPDARVFDLPDCGREGRERAFDAREAGGRNVIATCSSSSGPFLNAFHERFDRQELDEANDGLTKREVEILAWVARGKTNQEIAALLVVSPHTIRKHLEHTYEKLRVHTRTAAVARAFATSI